MDLFDCLLKFNLQLSQWIVISFSRLTVLGKIVVIAFLLTLLCLPFGVRTMLRHDRRHVTKTIPEIRPVMNYINATTVQTIVSTEESLSTTETRTTQRAPTTPMPPPPAHHRHRSKTTKHKHHKIQKKLNSAGTDEESNGPEGQRRKNILFLIADDLRAPPQFFSKGTGEKYELHIPNIERLAADSLVLRRAYCQYSLCGPSRSSMLTSRSPDTTKVYQNTVYWRESGGPFTTLPQYFRDNGYRTYCFGKVFHVQMHPQGSDPVSWSHGVYTPPVIRHIKDINANWMPVGQRERDKNPLEDEHLVARASKTLRRLARRSRTQQQAEPFFLAIGFYRPHVPMICPEEFFNKYGLEDGAQYLADVKWQTPKIFELYGLGPFEKGTKDNSHLTGVPDIELRYLRRAYFACISYVDHLIGVILKVLDDEGLTNSTIVSLVADHGFHLGENGAISKYSNYEVALHVPLVIRVPGVTDGGVASDSLVQLLDLFPTIAAAAGLPVPPPCPERSTDVRLCTEGQSLLPLTANPNASLHNAVFSQVSRGRDIMEYSIRTDRIRYVDFATFKRFPLPGNRFRLELDWNVNLFYTRLVRQLYDHARDPHERFNLYNYPEYRDYRNHLKNMLKERFKVIHDFPAGLY